MTWVEAAKKVGAGQSEDIRCPDNDDDFLEVTWIRGPGEAGEYRLLCLSCDAVNYMRMAHGPTKSLI